MIIGGNQGQEAKCLQKSSIAAQAIDMHYFSVSRIRASIIITDICTESPMVTGDDD